MTREEIERIDALAKAAVDGPVHVMKSAEFGSADFPFIVLHASRAPCDPNVHAARLSEAEAQYYAALRNAWPTIYADLLAALDAPALRRGLRFYANQHHFDRNEPHEWDTVSDEPPNFWCDAAGTATVEDGTVAAKTLRGESMDWEGEEPAPITGEKLIAALDARREGMLEAAKICDTLAYKADGMQATHLQRESFIHAADAIRAAQAERGEAMSEYVVRRKSDGH